MTTTETQVLRLYTDRKSSVDYEYEVVSVALAAEHRVFRAVRPDGEVLLEWATPPAGSYNLINPTPEPGEWFRSQVSTGWPPLRADGDYEYQQLVAGQWVTLTRIWQPPREDRG